jgi:hypothetical protein
MALVRFQDLRLLVADADGEAYSQEAVRGWPVADLLLVLPASAGRYDGLAPLRALRDGMPVVLSQQAEGRADDRADGRPDGRPDERADGEAHPVSAATGPRLYPMAPWNALDLRKHGTRLRVTAMPGPPGTAAVAGYLIEVGNSRASYRLYAGTAGVASVSGAMDSQAAALAQRLPGADLALLPGQEGPQLLALHRGAPPPHAQPAALTAAGQVFRPLRR